MTGFFTAFGTIQYSFSGLSGLPTIHADMAEKSQFKWAAVISYMLLLVFYLPEMILTYIMLGDCIKEDVINTLNPGPSKVACQILMALHLVAIFPIMINAPNQYFESTLRISAGLLLALENIYLALPIYPFHS